MRYFRLSAPLLLVTPLVLAGAAASLDGQVLPTLQAPRDARGAEPPPTGTASISGVLTVAGSGQPARRARVSLSSAELRGGRSVSTDDAGRFAFVALPAGRFSLSASKPGHVSVTYGQRLPGRPGTPIQLRDGQTVDVQLQIPRGGVITGTVLDEHGDAVPGTPVRVMRYAIQNGYRTLRQAGGGDTTDDRGVYRIYGLQPGDYLVAATPRNTGPAAAILRVRAELEALRSQLDAAGREEPARAGRVQERMVALQSQLPDTDESVSGYAPVYYPGTTMPSGAGTIAVGVGEEKGGIAFQLQLVPIATVEGIVVAATGSLPPNTQVALINLDHNLPGMGNNTTRAGSNGTFRLSNVVPGQYLLVARSAIGGGRGRRGGAATLIDGRGRAPQPSRLWAMTPLSVDGRNVSNLVLTLQPGMTIAGRIAFDGTATPPADLSRVRVFASPADLPGPAREIASSVTGQVDSSGRFTISGVVPGRYRIMASGIPNQGWTLLSSVVSGQDTLDFPMEVKPNENVSNAVLTFSDRMAEVAGTIVDERGQPASDYTIVVYPADQEFRGPGSRRIRSQRPGTDGSFTFRSLPPGEYRIAPVLDPEPGTWFDPAFLQQLDGTALRVPLGPGEKKVQNLRISGG